MVIAVREGPGSNPVLPMVVPDFVARSVGCRYVHEPVCVHRLVMEEMGGGILRVCGTIRSKLCHIPLRGSVGVGHLEGFRSTCRSIRNLVMPMCPTGMPAPYPSRQWCIAILPPGSTIESGPCRLVMPIRGGSLQCREVKHPLLEEMGCMGCLIDGAGVVPLPPHTNEHNRSVVTLPMAVEHLIVCYTGGVMCSVDRVPGQSLDVHRYLDYGSPAMVAIKDGLRRLWNRSFECHGCFGFG